MHEPEAARLWGSDRGTLATESVQDAGMDNHLWCGEAQRPPLRLSAFSNYNPNLAHFTPPQPRTASAASAGFYCLHDDVDDVSLLSKFIHSFTHSGCPRAARQHLFIECLL